jgi:hypothetical protein
MTEYKGLLSFILYPKEKQTNTYTTLWLLVRKRTITTDRPPLVGEVSVVSMALHHGH